MLKEKLSLGAKVATVDECTSLPVHFHEKRFYTAEDLLEANKNRNGESTTAAEPLSDYSIWIDRYECDWNSDRCSRAGFVVEI